MAKAERVICDCCVYWRKTGSEDSGLSLGSVNWYYDMGLCTCSESVHEKTPSWCYCECGKASKYANSIEKRM